MSTTNTEDAMRRGRPPERSTRWRIVGTPDRPHLNVELVVATTAEAVVDAIERAARGHGIRLERVEEAS